MEIKRNIDDTFELRGLTRREMNMLRQAILGHAREIHQAWVAETNEDRALIFTDLEAVALKLHEGLSSVLNQSHLAPDNFTISLPIPFTRPTLVDEVTARNMVRNSQERYPQLSSSNEDPQDEGEAARQAQGIDGTMGDAQDIPHRYVKGPVTDPRLHPGCLLCGMGINYKKHMTSGEFKKIDIIGEIGD